MHVSLSESHSYAIAVCFLHCQLSEFPRSTLYHMYMMCVKFLSDKMDMIDTRDKASQILRKIWN